jgi:signal transduction histidine kinase
MRFDDMIATVLAQRTDRSDRLAAQWSQLVDLLGQNRAGPGNERARAFDCLRERRLEIPIARRIAAASTLTGLSVDPELVAFFAEDQPAVAAPLIAGVRLTAEEWLSILPRLAPPARALLRHRRDLPFAVEQALSAFGHSDFALENAHPATLTEPAGGPSQIRELVDRIEAYRRHQSERRVPAAEPQADTFRWETGSDGTLRWIEGIAREALVGQTIAAIAGPGQHGVDGQAAGAFEKRSPFRDARFSVAGQGTSAGDWRISGVPFFDPNRGAFLGYRGVARRPRVDEVARLENDAGVMGSPFPPDSLRQLIHELRTPLNAIIGFAEMIEGQYLGPAAPTYRDRASGILDSARRLLSAVDDLDTAARIESRRLELNAGTVDAAALLGRLHDSYQRVAEHRGTQLTLDLAADLPPASVEAGAVERMFGRLLAATIGLAESETIGAVMTLERRGKVPMLRLAIDRPQSIADLNETSLLDPGYSPDGDWPGAPVLGLGFALRLVRNLAQAAGGDLVIGDERISLLLPAVPEIIPAAGSGEAGT